MLPPINAAQVRELLAAHASVHLPSGEEINVRSDSKTFLDGLAEASFLVSQGDRRLAPSEMNCLAGTLSELSSGDLDRSALAGLIYEFAVALEREGLDARVNQLGVRFTAHDERLRLMAFASLVALCDRTLQPGEEAVLRAMASRLGIPIEEVEAFVQAMQSSIHTP